jgi:peptide chain release factor subunit 1
LAVQHFITADKVNVTGLVLAGSADFKSDLAGSDLLDGRLGAKVIKIVDVSYGSENGFNQGEASSSSSIEAVLLMKSYNLSYRALSRIPGKRQIRSGEKAYPEVLR